MVLPAAILLAGLPGCRDGSEVDLAGTLELLRRPAVREAWPGFDPTAGPLAVHDGERTFLFGHREPPQGFEPLRGWEGAAAAPGAPPWRPPTGLPTVEGVPTAAVASPPGAPPGPRALAAALLREAFRAHLRAEAPERAPREASVLDVPIRDPERVRERRLETTALRRAGSARDSLRRVCWARSFLDRRGRRFARLPEEVAAWERAVEREEGLAAYVAGRALSRPPDPLPAEGFPVGEPHRRAVAVGAAAARLLDRLDPGWRRAPGTPRSPPPPDRILAGLPAVRSARPCRLTPDELRRTRAVARRDVAARGREGRAARRAFERRPGWRVTVRLPEDAPARPVELDPGGILLLEEAALVEGWVRLEGAGIRLEGRGPPLLLEAVPSRSLSRAVGRVTVTGLSRPPRLVLREGRLELRAPGLEGAFRGFRARVEGEREWMILPLATGGPDSGATVAGEGPVP